MITLQTCSWLLDNEGSFKPMILDADPTKKETVRGYVQSEIHNYLRVPASTGKADETVRQSLLNLHCHSGYTCRRLSRCPCSSGHTERLPDPKEADKLARAILLCVDMEGSQPGAEIGNTLETLLSPLLDTLSRVSTNIYLPMRKSDKSLQLVLRLFQLGRTPSCQHAGKQQGL